MVFVILVLIAGFQFKAKAKDERRKAKGERLKAKGERLKAKG
jgi:transcriptional antiterminator Rof (Rho-off)